MVKTRGYRVELDGPGFTREQVLDHCPRRVPGYMVPDVVEFCEVLPGTPTARSTVSG
jgi:hypothetical protein